RLAKDFEKYPSTEQAWIYIAAVQLLIRQLARA
ncbi:MAG TPA: IS5/IS1182 family transposase, partial [Alphaproteobacteria bacterium]|nr:IS5/IS1182 family transposase [Alphaproteobacteria bacterium]